MIYKFFYWIMLLSYFVLSIQGGTVRMKVLGFVLTIANALIFWKG